MSTDELLARIDRGLFPDDDSARAFVSGVVDDPLGPGARVHPPGIVAAVLEGLYRFLSAPLERPGRVELVRDGAPTLVDSPDVAVLRTATPDARFLVDSLKQVVERSGLRVRHLLHPVFQVRRDDAGRIEHIDRARPGAMGERESVIHLELDAPDEATGAALIAEAERVLAAAHAVIGDFDAMRGRVATVTSELATTTEQPPPGSQALSPEDVSGFAHWLLDDSFVFLGARSYAGPGAPRAIEGTSLGILGDGAFDLPPRPAHVFELPRRLLVDKTRTSSPIHRLVAMDDVAFRFFEGGRVVREERFLGLFTRKALRDQPTRVPVLEEKLARILAGAGVIEGGYDARELTTAFNSLPIADLFLMEPEIILEAMRASEASYTGQMAKLVLRHNLTGTLHVVGLTVPDRQMSYDGLKRALALIEEHLGEAALDRPEGLARHGVFQTHLYVPRDPARAVDADALEREVREILEPWEERFAQLADGDADRRAWAAACPPTYRELTPPARAVADLALLEGLDDEHRVRVAAVHPGDVNGGDLGATQLRIAQREAMGLGALMPVLGDFALDVLDETHHRFDPAGAEPRFLDVLRVRALGGGQLDPQIVDRILCPALERVLDGSAPADGMNGLSTVAGLEVRQVAVVRAYVHHAFQLKLMASRTTAVPSLLAHPHEVRALVAWFETRFDPELAPEQRAELEHQLAESVNQQVERVADPADYRILDTLKDGIAATVRTNHFRHPARRSEALALKIDPTRLAGLPTPVPRHEIFVLGADMAGVHLRGGDVARGGLRFSDRPDDFRTEVLGLMATQMVKNAIIVPTGAKGGFVLHRPPTDRAQLAVAARAAYERFIRALLDVTDDRDDEGRAVPPERVVRLDGDDPYMVVAADKGTASFSDVANGIARDYDFWLDDAFASGGSRGYDHKELGITARGAWECGKQHFLELGLDPERDPITAVGIGDCSGDVFGNGMLLSRSQRLLGAFNHRHIFLDPDPDPERAYAERERCFREVLGWDGYDASAISAGGGVWPRSARAIPIPPQMAEILGTDAATATGEELVRMLLTARVDLLYNGGIGTYVKASTEAHSEANDKSNDAVRVDAADLGCRVIVEGGNLGLTAGARNEFASQGGRIHTDAIDNSGGVDLSDHEVNVKIALATARRQGLIDRAREDAVLLEATEPLCEAVLDDNRSQALVLGIDAARSREHFDRYDEMTGRLTDSGHLDPHAQGLPRKRDLQLQGTQGVGFYKPQLAALVACEKQRILDELLVSPIVDHEGMASFLHDYFPAVVREAAGAALEQHPLRREIIATQAANAVVNDAGLAFVSEAESGTGASVPEVVGATVLVERVLDPGSIRALLATHAREVGAEVLYELHRALGHVLAQAVQGNLRRRILLEPTGPAIRDLLGRLAAHGAAAEDIEGPIDAPDPEAGAEGEIRARIAALARSASVFTVAELARTTSTTHGEAASIYLRLGVLLRIDELDALLARLPQHHGWDRLAATRLGFEIDRDRVRIASALLTSGAAGDPASAFAAHPRTLERHHRALDRLLAEGHTGDIHGLYVVEQRLGELAVALAT